ncbi:MAG: RDD family protein [Deltaproteobacteria bacterium]|nr:RDD family protein [Deltaproteobacteria bacterium]
MLQYPVVTPENVRFHYTLAGPGTRLLALLIDGCLLAGGLVLLSLGLALVLPLFGDYAAAVYGLLSSSLVLGYWIGWELRWNGQTPGKRLLGLRVVGDQGLRLEPTQVILRNVLRLVDLLPGLFGVGGLLALLHPEHRRIGDVVAGTLVIREQQLPPPERLHDALDRVHGRGAGAAPVAQRAREQSRRVAPAEQALLQELVLRRDTLRPDVRLRLFRAVAGHYRQLFAIEPEEGQSDERFVLAVADGLLGR